LSKEQHREIVNVKIVGVGVYACMCLYETSISYCVRCMRHRGGWGWVVVYVCVRYRHIEIQCICTNNTGTDGV
jgi:hypothetical protein